MLPARFCQILFRNEKIGGQGESYRGYRHNFILCLHCLIENELFQPADKPRHRSSSLIITFFTALSVLGVLCICCLRVLPWNKPQWVIYLPNRRNPSAFHFLFFSSYSQICIIQILFKNLAQRGQQLNSTTYKRKNSLSSLWQFVQMAECCVCTLGSLLWLWGEGGPCSHCFRDFCSRRWASQAAIKALIQ